MKRICIYNENGRGPAYPARLIDLLKSQAKELNRIYNRTDFRVGECD